MSNLRIANGRIGKDASKGSVTCVKSRGSSTVDYVLCTPVLLNILNDFEVLPVNEYSDHNPIVFDLKVHCCQSALVTDIARQKMIWDSKKQDEFIRSLENENIKTLLEDMSNVTQNVPASEISVQNATDLFVDAIRAAADPLFLRTKHIPSNIKSSDKPVWANEEWVYRKKQFYKSRDRYNHYSTDVNREIMVNARSLYKQCCRKSMQRYKTSQTFKLLEAKHKNVKLYWKMLSDSKQINKCPVSNSDFYYYFMGLSNPEGNFYVADDDILRDYQNMIDDKLQFMFDELNVSIDICEVMSGIKELKQGKSSGADMLVNEFFITGKDILAPCLVRLFNYAFDSGIFPKSWSEGLLIPIHKKGIKSVPENYRGITLLSVLGKLFTRILNKRLDSWAESYGIYVEALYGFRTGRSTTDCIFILNNVINKLLKSEKTLYAFFVDYSKAFDYIVRENLCYKLLPQIVFLF